MGFYSNMKMLSGRAERFSRRRKELTPTVISAVAWIRREVKEQI
jgi:hypothetical protein